jgi:hypothetical protein
MSFEFSLICAEFKQPIGFRFGEQYLISTTRSDAHLQKWLLMRGTPASDTTLFITNFLATAADAVVVMPLSTPAMRIAARTTSTTRCASFPEFEVIFFH